MVSGDGCCSVHCSFIASAHAVAFAVGSDSCNPNESYCGLVSPHLASLMLEVFKCTQAMSMVSQQQCLNLSYDRTTMTVLLFDDTAPSLGSGRQHHPVDQGREPFPQRDHQPQRQQAACGTGISATGGQRIVRRVATVMHYV